jgi:predicted Zn-dependent peptidase
VTGAPDTGAPAPADKARIASSDAGLRRTRLANGLTVLSDYVPGVRSVAIGAWVRTASMHEPREQMGIAHCLEHLVFKGTARRTARELSFALETLGGTLDAYTARDHTCYTARVLDADLPVAADVLADLLFRPMLRAEDLALEQDVIREEIAMVEDTPDDLVFDLHAAHLWGDHPFGYRILGTRESVSAFTAGDLRALHARAYRPPEVVVAAAGNVTHEQLLDVLAETGWADVPAGDGPAPAAPPAAVAREGGHERVRARGQQVHLVLGGAGLSWGDPRRYALALVSTLLGDGMSSRLFQVVREEHALAYNVHTFAEYYAQGGIHGVYVASAPGKAAAAERLVRAELARLVRDGVSADDLAAAKRQLKGQLTLSFEGVSSRMNRAASSELAGRDYRPLEAVLDEIDALDAEVVHDICRSHFDHDRLAALSLGPTR